MGYSPPCSSVHGILQARKLEWVAISSSGGSSQSSDRTHITCSSCIAGRFFTTEPPGKPSCMYYIHFLLLSCVQLFAPRWTAACHTSLSIISWHLLKLMSIELVISSNISFSVIPFSSSLQSFPASGLFPASQFFKSGGQSIGVSASVSLFPMNIQD